MESSEEGYHLVPSPSGTHPRGESLGESTGGCEIGLRGCVHHVPWPDVGMEVSGWFGDLKRQGS